jgi:hypothetical protein
MTRYCIKPGKEVYGRFRLLGFGLLFEETQRDS